MNQQNDAPNSSGNQNNDAPQKEGSEQTIAQNPNPRANANIKGAPFEKTTENDGETTDVGSEITDGEGG